MEQGWKVKNLAKERTLWGLVDDCTKTVSADYRDEVFVIASPGWLGAKTPSFFGKFL